MTQTASFSGSQTNQKSRTPKVHSREEKRKGTCKCETNESKANKKNKQVDKINKLLRNVKKEKTFQKAKPKLQKTHVNWRKLEKENIFGKND